MLKAIKLLIDEVQQKFPIGQHVAIGDENYERGAKFHRCKVIGHTIDDYRSTIDVQCPYNKIKKISIHDTILRDSDKQPLVRPRKKEKVDLDDIHFQYTGHYFGQDDQGKEYIEGFFEPIYMNDEKNEKYRYSDISIEEEEKLLKDNMTQKGLQDLLYMARENFDHLDFMTPELEQKWLSFYEKEGDEGVSRLPFKTRGVKPEFDNPYYIFRFYLKK